MFKSILDWIVGTEPVSRWIIILMFLGMLAGFIALLKKHAAQYA